MATGESNIETAILPQDLMIEILSWLPVKILMRLRCVCKYWNSVIGSGDLVFVSKHLQNYYHSTKNTGRLFLQCAHPEYNSNVNALFSDPTLADLSYQYVDGVPGIDTRVLGPCNGIFLLWNQNSLAKALWNPATRECKFLPELQIPVVPQPFGSYTDEYAFGWDPLAEGFKVVIIQQELYNCCGPSGKDSRVLVYNDNSESWSYFTLSPRYFRVRDSPCYTCLSGAYYWSVHDPDDGDYIISFNMGTDLFTRIISIPNDGRVRGDAHGCLMVYNDSIAWCLFDRSINYLDLWVMSQDGGCNCWIRLFSVGPFLDFYFPFGYWKDGQIIIYSREAVFLFDPKRGIPGVRYLGITTSTCSMMLIYKESFVPLKGENYFSEVPPSWKHRLKWRFPPPCACDDELALGFDLPI